MDQALQTFKSMGFTKKTILVVVVVVVIGGEVYPHTVLCAIYVKCIEHILKVIKPEFYVTTKFHEENM